MESEIPSNNNLDNSLIRLINLYEIEIKPFEYKYELPFGIKLNFTFEPDKIPHLIFGTVGGFQNSSQYKGQVGYDNIINGAITSPHANLRQAFKSKEKGFKQLPKLLDDPKIYHFNKEIVQSGNGCIKGFNTKIDADFLLHKEKTHLFIKLVNGVYIPVSLVYNKSDTYINNQIKMKILNDKSTFKCLRPIDRVELISAI